MKLKSEWISCGIVGRHPIDLPLRWRHNGGDSVSNHQPRYCLLNRLFRRRSKKTSKLCVTGFCVGNSPGPGEFPAQMASNAENVSIWWRHHARGRDVVCFCEFISNPFPCRWGMSEIRFYLTRPRQNGSHFSDEIFIFIFVNRNSCILIQMLLKIGPNWSHWQKQNHHWFIIMAWYHTGKPSSQPMMTCIYLSLSLHEIMGTYTLTKQFLIKSPLV